ncbi:F-box family protein [Striga asiatica]|uniref:F-box family protein n=1 Tax=Striga asiatica TaxID=4170 RepID=A0A5A7Q653_STRAF|nr:F-box family protein [Striga asiatica]
MLKPKNKNSQQASNVDHFERLLDELLLSILSRLDDLKHLFPCSLVSKRFDFTTFCVQSVSITLLKLKKYAIVSVEDIYHIPHLMLGSLDEETQHMPDSRAQQDRKRRRVQTGKPVFGLSMAHLRAVFQPVKCSTEWIFMLSLLVRHHCFLERIVIRDTEGKGSLVVGPQAASCFMMNNPVPELRLPVTGYVLKGVCFMVIRGNDEQDNGVELGEVMYEGEDEDEKVLGEAVYEIVKRHLGKFFWFVKFPNFFAACFDAVVF